MYNRKKFGAMLEEKTWNMDALFTERINTRLNDLDIATFEANQHGRYRILHTIFIDTHFKYIDKVEELKSEFKDVKNTLSASTSGISKQTQAQHQMIVISKAEMLLDELHFKIMNLLYESDLICLKIKEGVNPELEFERDYK